MHTPNISSPFQVVVEQFNILREDLIQYDEGKFIVIATNGIVYPPTDDLAATLQFIQKKINNREIRLDNKNFLVLRISRDLPTTAEELAGKCLSNLWKDILSSRDIF